MFLHVKDWCEIWRVINPENQRQIKIDAGKRRIKERNRIMPHTSRVGFSSLWAKRWPIFRQVS
jgi:hypothetical protein